MGKIILMAETGSDIPVEQARELGIELVPMHVCIGDTTIDDGELPPAEMLERCRQLGVLPRTSGCTPHDFERAFARVHEADPEAQILYLAYSAATTCSYESARIAAEGLDYVTMDDTAHLTIGQALVVTGTAAWIAEHPGAGVDEALAYARELAHRTRMAFIPGDLGYLRAGGRLSNAAFVGATLLKIKPVVELLDGKLVATKKLRGKMERAALALIDYLLEGADPDTSRVFFIRTTGLPESVQRAAEDHVIARGFTSFRWYDAGNVITSHGGPGAFGLAFAVKE